MSTPLLANSLRQINVDIRFLLARLHMGTLMSQPTIGNIKQALQNLPQGIKGLDETYEQAMRRIEGQGEGYRNLAKQVLSWVTHSKRALSTAEVRHVLAVRVGIADLDEEFLPEVEILGSVCAGLVTVDENTDFIRLVHYTTQEYFERTSSFPNAETDITVTCVTYLSFDTFATGFCPSEEEFEARLRLNPLYDCAARNWGYHAGTASAKVDRLILDFLESEAKVAGSSQAMIASRGYSGYSQTVPSQTVGVRLAAYFKLSEAMIALLQNGHDPNVKDSYGQAPLSWTARNGHDAVVKLLLAKDGVDPDSKDKYGQMPLSKAAENGHEGIVRLLLATGSVNPDSKDTGLRRTPLSWAAMNGYEAVVKQLLAKDGVGLNPKDSPWGLTPLSWAAKEGREAVVRLLLANDGAEPDPRTRTSGVGRRCRWPQRRGVRWW